MWNLDFLKVLRFTFPVPVVGTSFRSLARFCRRNRKDLPLALRAREKNLSSTCRQVYMEPYGFLHKKTSMESCLFYMNSCTLQTSCRATHFFVTFRFLFFLYPIFQLTLLSLEPKNNIFLPQRRHE